MIGCAESSANAAPDIDATDSDSAVATTFELNNFMVLSLLGGAFLADKSFAILLHTLNYSSC
jgi:hypothetical protein